jgi:hypothetical protein
MCWSRDVVVAENANVRMYRQVLQRITRSYDESGNETITVEYIRSQSEIEKYHTTEAK